jgi:hypothetical protein
MGLHQIVWVKLSCRRCGNVDERNLFFDGDIVTDDFYKLGEVVPERKYSPNVFSIGEKYEGNACCYCWDCFVKWGVAQASSAYESLAELIESGRVTARIRGEADNACLLPREVLEFGNEYTSEFAWGDRVFPINGPFFEEFDLNLDDRPVTTGEKNWPEFCHAIDLLISKRMEKAGWGWNYYRTSEDFRVFLDSNRQIQVEDMRGRRLLKDGSWAA